MTLKTRKHDAKSFKQRCVGVAAKIWEFSNSLPGRLTASSVILILCILLILPDIQTAVKKEEQNEEPTLYLKDAYAALFRHLRSDKICYDEARNAYLIHFSKQEKKGEKEEADPWVGWWFINSPTFHYLKANNTWFLQEIPDTQFTRVWPDVDNVPCAEAEPKKDQ